MKPELFTFLKEKAKQSFDIKSNNCFIFTNECWSIRHGHKYADRYFDLNNLNQTEYSSLVDACDSFPHLTRSEKPQEGHLVAIKLPGDTYLGGYALGFCVGDLSVFLNDKGVRYLPTKLVTYSWSNKEE